MPRTPLLIIGAVALAVTAASDDECRDISGGSGISVDPSDCAGFIMCSNGIAFEMDCPIGTLFSASLLVCDFPHNVDCAGRPADDDGMRFVATLPRPSDQLNLLGRFAAPF